ncbi:MAG: GntR family transcriptional regulator [Clostridia bacterium]|nr:GntR family transcriptional regulator [Clostridia bacterium]
MFEINAMSRSPVYEQLEEQIERYILLGLLPEGSQLPSVRALSAELSVNPNTIQKAYGELDARGTLVSVPGRGCFVTEGAREAIRRRRLGGQGAFCRLVRELKAAGITKEELTAVLSAEYDGKE